MKITLAVLFLAGLTIYCKCTAVLSLPPSLIAHAASLERTQTPKSFPPDNGNAGEDSTPAVGNADDGAENGDGDGDGDGVGGIPSDVDSTVLYNNFKNLWQKNFGIQKRERNAFEDDIAAVVAAAATPQMMLQPQQQQPIAAIKNNKNALKVVPIPRQQHLPQQRQSADNGNNNFLNTKSSATIKPLEHQHHYQLPLELADDAEDYDSNKWLSAASGPQIMDDIIVSPPHGGPVAEDNRNDHSDDGDIPNYAKEQPTHTFNPEVGEENVYDTTAAIDDSPDPVVWNKFLRPSSYWPIECQGKNENNCPQAYYGALIADRRKALSEYLQHVKGMNQPYIPSNGDPSTATKNSPPYQDSNEIMFPSSDPETINSDDIVLLLTAEQKLVQFLSWALAELYPLGKFSNVSENSADSYHPGIYLWKKFNLSGRLEPPLLVEEPRYVIVRREYDPEEEYKRDSLLRDDPFIPPRGRKHNLPDLDALLQRYETFVPNRGRRDKIKDIFKYDDLFYPNRGKRQMTLATTDNSYNDADADADDNINLEAKQLRLLQRQQQLAKGENVAASLVQMQLQQHPLAKTLEQINNEMAKMKRKLHQIQLKRQQQQKNLANTFDEMMSNKMPATRMSTTYQLPPQQHPQQLNKRFISMANILQQHRRQHNIPNNKNLNSRRQWWKRYSTMDDNDRPAASTAATSTRSRIMATNRLHALRSMSPEQQQLLAATSAMAHQRQQQSHHVQHTSEYLSPPRLYQANKFMWQPRQQYQLRQPTLATALTQQFDPLPWHKLQMLQHQYHLPLLTMRHPRLTAQQHLPAPVQQHVGGNDNDEQLATPQETQLPLYSSIDPISTSVDNTVANDLKNLYNMYSD